VLPEKLLIIQPPKMFQYVSWNPEVHARAREKLDEFSLCGDHFHDFGRISGTAAGSERV
jgi:hypothetical protein